MIGSLANPLIRQARLLRQRKSREATSRFLVEGLHPVGAALEAGWRVAALLYTSAALESKFAAELVQDAASAGVRTEAVSGDVMSALASKDNPQGLMAVVEQKQTPLHAAIISTFAVALFSPQDPGNLGTVLRTVDAVGGQAVFLLDGGVDAFHPTAVRASMGSLFWVPTVKTASADFLAWCRGCGVHVVGSSASAAADYRSVCPRTPWILAMGNEQRGLPQAAREACDDLIRIPMQGRASSLNLAAAAAVLLYAYADLEGASANAAEPAST